MTTSTYLKVPLDKLTVSKLNVRPASKMGNIEALAASIDAGGLIHPIVVRKNGKGYEILAGQRRFAAYEAIQASADDDVMIEADCKLVDVDDSEARAISLSENTHIEPMSVIDEWRAFTNLIKDGWVIEAISEAYSKPVSDVRRILALGGLPKYVLDAYEAGDIDAEALKLLAVAPKSRVTEWGKLYRSDRDNCPCWGHSMRNFVGGGRKYCADVAIFDVEKSGLVVVNDLFNDNSFFADGEAFAVEQEKAIEELIEELKGQGSKKRTVERLDENYFPEYDYPKVSLKDGGRIYVRVSHDGSVEVHKGRLPRKQAEKLAAGENVATDKPKTKKAELPAKTVEYISHYMTKAARCAVDDNSDLALCTLLATIICNSESSLSVRDGGEFDRIAEVIGEGEIYKSATQKRLLKQRAKAYKPVFKGETIFNWDRPDFDAVLVAIMGLSQSKREALLCAVTGEIVSQNGRAVSSVIATEQPKMSDHWDSKNGQVFFELVRNKTALLGMLNELTGSYLAHEKDTIKVLQQLVKDAALKKPDWIPAYFEGGHYDSGEGLDVIKPLVIEKS